MQNAIHPFSLATDLADYLTEKGLPFREAHHIVGKLVRDCVESNKNLSELSPEEFQGYSNLFQEDIFDWLTIEHSLNRRNILGGTGPKAVQTAIEKAKELLNQISEDAN